jgi:hypothetical protein
MLSQAGIYEWAALLLHLESCLRKRLSRILEAVYFRYKEAAVFGFINCARSACFKKQAEIALNKQIRWLGENEA